MVKMENSPDFHQREGVTKLCCSHITWCCTEFKIVHMGSSNPVLWDSLKGWERVGGGREGSSGNLCAPMAESCRYMVEINTIL